MDQITDPKGDGNHMPLANQLNKSYDFRQNVLGSSFKNSKNLKLDLNHLNELEDSNED